MSKFVLLLLLTVLSGSFAVGQANQYKVNPPKTDDETEKITIEEIKLNVTARNDFGHFDPSLVLNDVMVVEDRVPHPIASLRRVPASVLIVLDTGGEMKTAKNLTTTKKSAANLLANLKAENSLALIHYSDKAEVLCDWTTNQTQFLEKLKKTNFGKRSRFIEAMNLSVKMLAQRPLENRHLVLITDGTDSASDKGAREKMLTDLIAANVTVHVLSYTALEQAGASNRSIFKGGEHRPRRMPDEHKIALPSDIQAVLNMPRIGSINTDSAMIRAARKRREALKESETNLTKLALETGGEMILPDSIDTMPEQSKSIAEIIEAQYVLTYVPKRALANSQPGEIREIGVVARRVGLIVNARRKFVVPVR